MHDFNRYPQIKAYHFHAICNFWKQYNLDKSIYISASLGFNKWYVAIHRHVFFILHSDALQSFWKFFNVKWMQITVFLWSFFNMNYPITIRWAKTNMSSIISIQLNKLEQAFHRRMSILYVVYDFIFLQQ